jgi:hypothetical protein
MRQRGVKFFICGATVISMLTFCCSKKKEDTGIVPPGFCKTEQECQPLADRQNAYQEGLRQKLTSQGVHEQYLPCGTYEVTKAANGFWEVSRNTRGCASTASQPDPHPDPSRRHP